MFSEWYYAQDGKEKVRSPENALCNAICRTAVCLGSIFIGTFMLIISRLLFFVDMIFSAE